MIHKDMIVFEVLQHYPEATQVLEKYGMKCSECLAVMEESLEISAKKHNVDLDILLNELNNACGY